MKPFICLKLIIVNLLCCSFQVNAQETDINPLPVKVTDDIRSQLACFELGKNRLETPIDSAYMAMYIYNLGEPQETLFTSGIYTYQILGPHFSRKLFIYYNNEIHAFKSVFVNELVQEFLTYSLAVNLPVNTRIAYLKSICQYLDEEYNEIH